MENKQISILLMAYGSPDSIENVGKYYTNIRGGKKPSEEEIRDLKRRYELIGGKSPLLDITREQARKLEKLLNSTGSLFRVFVGMKHFSPLIHESVREIIKLGFKKMVALPLVPHYSRMTIGGYHEAVKKAVGEDGAEMKVYNVESWATHHMFIKSISEKIKEKINKLDNPFIVFTAHSLPDGILSWNDPYPDELEKTCKKIAEGLKLKKWMFSYQSAGNKPGWLKPDILETLNRLESSGVKNILVCPIGFVADNMEILYDIDIEAREFAESKGINLERTQSLNTSRAFIETLASIVKDALRGL